MAKSSLRFSVSAFFRDPFEAALPADESLCELACQICDLLDRVSHSYRPVHDFRALNRKHFPKQRKWKKLKKILHFAFLIKQTYLEAIVLNNKKCGNLTRRSFFGVVVVKFGIL